MGRSRSVMGPVPWSMAHGMIRLHPLASKTRRACVGDHPGATVAHRGVRFYWEPAACPWLCPGIHVYPVIDRTNVLPAG
jgi:hypothetical protein